MKPTWIVLGLALGLGAVAYAKLREVASERESAKTPLARTVEPRPGDAKASEAGPPGAAKAGEPATPPPPDGTPPLAKSAGAAPSTPPTSEPAEQAAAALRASLVAARKAGDSAAADAIENRLDGEFRDTAESRRVALDRGATLAKEALRDDRPLDARVPVGDRARRDLSRALFLPEMFDPAGAPTEDRRRLVATIVSLNTLVMTYAKGLAGVTTVYDVKPGDNPVRIVSRERLPYGPNVLLFWNHGGNLDPSRLRAGERLVLPAEALEVRVDRARHRAGLYVGGVLAKEFEVGVGKPSTPTPPGVYEVKDKYLNPDWHVPPELQKPGEDRVIRYGDPRNELGDAWIPISSPDHPTGFGIHGTVRPETVGTDCSNGCVRLRNAEAVEMTTWVRTAKNEGAATRVVIR